MLPKLVGVGLILVLSFLCKVRKDANTYISMCVLSSNSNLVNKPSQCGFSSNNVLDILHMNIR